MRLLKRDYDTKELLEIGDQMVVKALDEQKSCYDNASRTSNAIALAYHRQIVRLLKLRLKQESDRSGDLF